MELFVYTGLNIVMFRTRRQMHKRAVLLGCVCVQLGWPVPGLGFPLEPRLDIEAFY